MDEYYSVNQAAFILKIHPLTVRRYIREGRLKAVRVGGGVRMAKADIDEFIKSFVPHARTSNLPSKARGLGKEFDSYDPIFRLRARGASTEVI